MLRDKQMKCLKCDFEWMSYKAVTECPKCDHKYVKWLNYSDFSNVYQEWKDIDD